MSTHDEESAPLEETQASDEPGELEAGEASAEESFDTASVSHRRSPRRSSTACSRREPLWNKKTGRG